MMQLDHVFARLRPIGLDELNATAELLDRVDRKYFVPRSTLAQLLADQRGAFRILTISNLSAFRYHTVYFDTAEFEFYRQHRQGRRHRFKVRTRTYCDSGDSMLEVKAKGHRGMTLKYRQPHPADQPRALSTEAQQFVSPLTGLDATTLAPVVATNYRRTTLCGQHLRITLDTDLEYIHKNMTHHGPDDVLVETKSSGAQGPLDRALLKAGIRPHSISKYCTATALLYPHLPRNPWNRILRRCFPT